MTTTGPRYLVALAWSRDKNMWSVLTEELFPTPSAAARARPVFEQTARDQLAITHRDMDRRRIRFAVDHVRYLNVELAKDTRKTVLQGSESRCKEELAQYVTTYRRCWISVKACNGWEKDSER